MSSIGSCHADYASCVCCGSEAPEQVVMGLINAIAGESLEEYRELADQVQLKLSDLFAKTGIEDCPKCVLTKSVQGVFHDEDDCCDRPPLKPVVGTVSLDSEEGKDILKRAPYQRDLLPLLAQFETQQEGWWCGVAASTMVLNALPIERPPSKYAQYRLFTQARFFDDPKAKELGLAPDNKEGISLTQLAEVMHAKTQVEAKLHQMVTPDPDLFREQVKASLLNEAAYLIVNYSRSAADQGSGAHFSPVAAYNEEADAVLILDTAKFKYAPFWMSVDLAVKAMNTADSKDATAFRGFLVLRAANTV